MVATMTAHPLTVEQRALLDEIDRLTGESDRDNLLYAQELSRRTGYTLTATLALIRDCEEAIRG